MKLLLFSSIFFINLHLFSIDCIEVPLGNGEYEVVIPEGYTECEIDSGGGGSGGAAILVLGGLALYALNNKEEEPNNFSNLLMGNGLTLKETDLFKITTLDYEISLKGEVNNFRQQNIKSNKINILSIKIK